MKKSKRIFKVSLTAFLCACLCIPLATLFAKLSVSALSNQTATANTGLQMSARQVTAQKFVIPKDAVVDDLNKEPSENSNVNQKVGAVTVPAKKLSAGAAYHILAAKGTQLRGHGWPTNIWNWASGPYYGSVSMLGDLYTNYCFQPSGIGKLWINIDFQSDTAIGYSYEITCYDRNTGNAVVSWSSTTAPGGQSSPGAVSFYNLNKNHNYFFEFVNTQGYGAIKGDFDIEQQDS